MTDLLRCIEEVSQCSEVSGIAYRDNHGPVQTMARRPLSMAEIPFPYLDLNDLENRIIYYETSRGCPPYSCEYCLSSIEKGVRFRPMKQVYEELEFFLSKQVKQVKFVDRTFNARKDHAMAIWQYLKDHDNGYTNFHFELTADLLTDEMIDYLGTLRTGGLVQFEIGGVQSTNEATIVDINRKVDFHLLQDKVLKIKEGGDNIHLHLDLIAGLPGEDYTSFAGSFNDVMAMRPEQLQLGFLKVLKGSQIHIKREAYGIVYREIAPYEVLYTDAMTYYELRSLKQIEELLELYYNSGLFTQSIEYLIQCFPTPFEFFEDFIGFYESKGYYDLKHTKLKWFEILFEYCEGCDRSIDINLDFVKALLIHDLCSKEKPKKWPYFVTRPEGTPKELKAFYKEEGHKETFFKRYPDKNSRQIQRMTHMESYPYDIIKWIEDGKICKVSSPSYYYYDYRNKHEMTGTCQLVKVTI